MVGANCKLITGGLDNGQWEADKHTAASRGEWIGAKRRGEGAVWNVTLHLRGE